MIKSTSKQMTLSGKSLLEENIEKSKSILKEFNENNKLLIGFSGGKDSSVLLDLAVKTLPLDDIYVIFEDTKIEFKETYDYTDFVIKDYYKIPEDHYFVTTPTKSFWDVLKSRKNKLMWVTRWRDCCYTLKKTPLNKVMHREGFDYAVSGVRKVESMQRSVANLTSHMDVKVDYHMLNPILEWTDNNIWDYIEENDLPINEIYFKGYERCGCAVCPCPNKAWDYYGKLRETHPNWYKAIMRNCDEGIKGEKFYRHTWKEVEG